MKKSNPSLINNSYCVYKRFKKKTVGFSRVALAVIIIASVIGSSSLYLLMNIYQPDSSTYQIEAAGEGWIGGGTWNYRRAIVLSSATIVANYQAKVTVDTAALVTAGKLQSNCNDIRFTDSNGTTNQDYWIESGCNTTSTIIWVEVATSGESTIYMYYGNGSAGAESNGSNTFIFFDDFEDGSKTGWTEGGGTWVESGGILSQTGTSANDLRNIYRIISGYTDYIVGFKIKLHTNSVDTSDRRGIILEFDTAIPANPSHNVVFINSNNGIKIGNPRLSWETPVALGFTLSTETWYRMEGYRGVNAQKGRLWNPATSAMPSWLVTGTTASVGYTRIGMRGGYDTANDFDDFYVRKYAATEPIASLGSEEYFSYLAVIGNATMDAGASQVITITAKTNLGNTYTGYAGDKSLTFSGANVSGGGNNPTCTNSSSADVNFGAATAVTFASGVAACTMKLYKAEVAAIHIDDGTKNSTGYDLSVAVDTPMSGYSIQINGTNAYTISKDTTLSLSVTGASQMRFSNNNTDYSAYEAYDTSKTWDITNVTYGGTSGDGAKTVYVIFKDAYGNEAAAVNDNIVYDTTAPVNSSSAIDAQGAVSDTWQNNKNDPNFTSFTGASDTNGIAGFYVYFGTSSTGADTNNWVASAAYNPASFSTSNTRYLRVITKDNAGLYADPDGAGTACDNTNANRPTDPDCWATIFIHKYDIDNPNTPSPSASPVSWTSTNSFNFSWSDPGDVGGSGVYNYTYQTNAGTSSTNTASTSVNSLTSNGVGAKLFSVKANDNAGNSGSNGTVNFYYDNTAPTNGSSAVDGNGSADNVWGINSDPNFTWTVGTDAGDQSGVKEYDVYWGTDSNGTTVTTTTSSNSYNPAAIPVNTLYYLRIKTRDNALNESGWATIFTMKYSQAASSPSGLSQTANTASLAFGDWTMDTAPILKFTLTDPDSDTLGYVIKIDNNSDFASPEVFYTYPNTLASGTEYFFTVGQAAGTGSYTNGNSGQTLSESQYYWKIKAIESHGLASNEVTANSGAAAFGIDTSNPTGTTLGFGAIALDSITATVSGAVDSVSGLNTIPYYFDNTTAITNSGWQTGMSWISESLFANTQYVFKVTSRDKAGNMQVTATQNKYTLANVPFAPTVNNATDATLDIDVNINSNPVSTEFAIYKETGASCDGAGGSYLAANGSDNGATAVWQTDAAWGIKTITGLAESAQYSFCVKAKNGDSIETAFSASASASTVASNAAPSAPVLVSPLNGAYTSDPTPTLFANYSDPDTGDTGATNYRISSLSLPDCIDIAGINIVAFGFSPETLTNNANTSWTPSSSIGIDGTYYWCAQNNDGSLTSNWTGLGSFVLDTAAPNNQNAVFAISISKQSNANVTIISSGDVANNVWFAPSGTTIFAEGAEMTKAANGAAVSILAPSAVGNYKLYVIDAAGNYSAESTAILTVDNSAPTIISISSDKANGSYKAGEIIDIDIIFSEAVTSAGNVTVTLETGDVDRTCSFAISNSSAITCDYTVQAGDNSSDLDATIFGAIFDQAGNALTNYIPATILSANKNLLIDTTAPSGVVLNLGTITASSITATVSGAVDSVSGLHATPYYYENTTAGTSSGWTANASWTSSFLSCGANYSFRIKARDALANESDFITSSISTLGCGGGLPPAAYNLPSAPASSPNNPEASFKVVINDNAPQTDNPKITLKFFAGADTKKMAVSESSDFKDAILIPYQQELKWELKNEIPNPNDQIPNKPQTSSPQIKTIYVKFYTAYGVASETFSDSIILNISSPKPASEPQSSSDIANNATQPSPEITDNKKIPHASNQIPIPPPDSSDKSNPEPIPYFQTPENKPEPVNPDWNLIKSPEVKNFFPRQNEISFYAQKLPSLAETFAKLNISNINDISSRASGASFNVPNLSEIINLKSENIGASQAASFLSTPLINLSVLQKEKIPSEIAFVSVYQEKINLNSSLILDEGSLKQKISVSSSTNLSIAIKPEYPTQSISGYIALKKSAYSFNDKLQMSNVKSMSNYEMINYQNNSGIENLFKIENLKLKISSLLGFKNVIAQEVEPIEPEVNPQSVEQRFVLAQFQYTDPDQDGIWTADIQTPAVTGEYEIISLISYQDPNIPNKEVRLIAVIDPEGYVYEKTDGKEARISNATVSIYRLKTDISKSQIPMTNGQSNSKTQNTNSNFDASEYELWNAENYDQKNPQTTDATGKYSFLVPEGKYYLKAEAPGYHPYQTDIFEVSEAENVHMNLQLAPEWSMAREWKTMAIIVLAIIVLILSFFLAYNFYQDRKRKV